MTAPTNFETLTRPTSPNTYLVLPKGFQSTASADEPSPVFAMTAKDLHQAVRSLILDKKRWSIVAEDSDRPQLELVVKTKLLRFKDDVSIRCISTGETSSALAIYSRSRLGHSDLGANKKRVQSLLEELKEKASGAA